MIEIRKPVSVTHNGAQASLSPGAKSRFEFEIDFPTPAIGRQSLALDLSP